MAAWLTGCLENGSTGDRLPTMRDLMKRFGIAQRVVERVLKPHVAAGRLMSRRGAGLTIAEPAGRQGKHDADLLILYRLSDSRLANTLLHELEQRLKARGVDPEARLFLGRTSTGCYEPHGSVQMLPHTATFRTASDQLSGSAEHSCRFYSA
ncbi:GntR family transcriptional regulator [Paracoccus saliphilus]|uniref:GntR family transcriptional regulator n=1 Tax=Paracoccus saliphilus TaxID=405559 RepID=A0ABY7S7I8_9RHOB|nr:GntR family transcriptional regulator [Paracoccus saliphilus]